MIRFFLLMLLALSSTASAIVIRDDVDDSKYRISPAEFPALVDMPGEGHGVLIAPQWVITAAHAIAWQADINQVVIKGVSRDVERVVMHSGYKTLPQELIDQATSSGEAMLIVGFLASSDDIALVKLTQPVTDVVPVAIYQDSDEPDQIIKIMGKGATGTGATGHDPKGSNRTELRRAFNQVTSAHERWFCYVFDQPPSALPLEGVLGNGDSGGPALIQVNDQWLLAGLASWKVGQGHVITAGTGRYGQVSCNVRLSHYRAWIDSVLATQAASAADQARPAESDITPETYAVAGELVRVGAARALNLRCSGSGEPVVMLEAGGNSDSSSWFRVQAPLASMTRVCSYDRAGYGFSDEGPLPRGIDAAVTDLRALIKAAGIPVPVMLIGHSLGSNIVRSYAQQHPQEVAGLVLVDPPEQGPDDPMPQDWQAEMAAQVAHREEILNLRERAALAGDTATLTGKCLRAPPPWMSEAVGSAMNRNKAKPSYWRALRAELVDNAQVFSQSVPAAESYGAVPLILLSAPPQNEDAPSEVLQVIEAARSLTRARIMAASTRSVLVEVPDTSHDIQLDQPQAVVAALAKLLDARGGADAPVEQD